MKRPGIESFIFSALCLAVFLLPLPYGAVEEWSIYAFEAVTLILFAVSTIGSLMQRPVEDPVTSGDVRSHKSVHLYLKALLGFFFLIIAIQILPLPTSLVKILSPQAFALASDGRLAIQTIVSSPPPRFLTLSLSPALTSYEFIKYLCYFLFAWLVYSHVRTRRQMEIFVWIILAAGLFQAIYGLTQLWGGTGRIFAWKNKYNQGSAFGTYVNRDHYSGFLEMVFPLSIGYLLAKARFFSMKPGLSLKEKILWYSQERLQKTLILAMLSVLLGLGIIFSRCRAGVLIFLVSLFLMSLIVSAAGSRRRHKSSHRDSGPSPKLIRTIFIGVAAAAVLIGLNPIISRFTKENVAFDKGRAVYYQNSLELASRFPLSGSGAGTFVHAYPLVEKEDASGLLTHAHNDYLEILAEAGFPAGVGLILAGLGMLGFLFGRWLKRRDHFVRGIALGAMIGIMALLIHGFLDFNLRIPANAVYFFVLFALALRAVRLPSQG
jgi:O-antigen ligase